MFGEANFARMPPPLQIGRSFKSVAARYGRVSSIPVAAMRGSKGGVAHRLIGIGADQQWTTLGWSVDYEPGADLRLRRKRYTSAPATAIKATRPNAATAITRIPRAVMRLMPAPCPMHASNSPAVNAVVVHQ